MMIKYIHSLAVVLLIGLVSCEPELSNPIDEPGFYSNGEADFTTYVALGNSMAAGYADGALYRAGQENSFPRILAGRFALTQETMDFQVPYMDDNTGGLLMAGQVIAENRLVLAVDQSGNPAPKRYSGAAPSTDITRPLEGAFGNLGVPGARSYHLVAPGYGNLQGVVAGTANPYFVRFASSGTTSVLQDALVQEPTFFTLWMGNNDVLQYATSGGTGVDQTNNTMIQEYGPNDITDPNVFSVVYAEMVDKLMASASGGVLINIPDVAATPFFTTVPNDALVLEADQAAQLSGFFQAVAQVLTGVLMEQGYSQAQAQAVASQYVIGFQEGPNRFLIAEESNAANPLGFRQMTQEELLLLTLDQAELAQGYGSVRWTPELMEVLTLLQEGQQPNNEQVNRLFAAISGIEDADVLDSAELENIRAATDAYNAAIASLAAVYELPVLDSGALLEKLQGAGYPFDAGIVTSDFATGGAFSLDGLHLTPRGNALLTNELIALINSTYEASVPKVNIADYGTVTLSNAVD